MGILAKNLPYKNLAAKLSHVIKRNGRCYTSMIQIARESYQDENDVIEEPKRNTAQFKFAESNFSIRSSVDKTHALNSASPKTSVSNFRANDVAGQFSKSNSFVKEKLPPFPLFNKSLSTSSIIWSKKSKPDKDGGCKKSDPNNNDFPNLSKLFGGDNLLMRSDAYNQALVEAARRRAALQESESTSSELKSYKSDRPQVLNIKGWGVPKISAKPALEPKAQTPKTDSKKTDKCATKDAAPSQSTDLWNADAKNVANKQQASKPCPPTVKTSDLWNTSIASVRYELKRELTPSSKSVLPVKCKKHPDDIDDEICKEELEVDKKRKEEEKTRNKKRMPTGCVFPKCKDDKCKKPPNSPCKTASMRKKSRRETLKAAKRLRGCISKLNDKVTKSCDTTKIVSLDRKKRPLSAIMTNLCQQKHDLKTKTPCGSDKQKESPCGSSKEKDDPCGSKKKDPCQDKPNPCKKRDTGKKQNPCDSDKKSGEGEAIKPCGSSQEKKDPCQEKKSSPCSSRSEESNKDPCKASAPTEIAAKRHCGTPRVTCNKSATSSGTSCGGKELPEVVGKRHCGSSRVAVNENAKTTISMPEITGKRHCGTPRVICNENTNTTTPMPEITGKRHCGTPRVTCNNSKSSSSTSCGGKELPEIIGKRHCGGSRVTVCTNTKTTIPMPEITGKRHCGAPRVICNKTSSSASGGADKLPKIIGKRHCGSPRVGCNKTKSASNASGSGEKLPGIIGKRHCGTPRIGCNKTKASSNTSNSESSSCAVGGDEKLLGFAGKRHCGTPRVGCNKTNASGSGEQLLPGIIGKPYCGIPRIACNKSTSSSSTSGSSVKLPKIAEKRHCGTERVPKSNCNNASSNTGGSQKAQRKKRDCGRLNRLKKSASTCSAEVQKEVSKPVVRRPTSPCGPSASMPAPSGPSASGPKTSGSTACVKAKRDTKPNCSNTKIPFTTSTTNPSPSLCRMATRTLTTLPSIRANIFMRKFSSKSRDENRKNDADIGKATKCKIIGTTVPPHRKPAYNPHPNDHLRQCYPTYDMDCKRLCKDARKSSCQKYAFLESTNNNKRKGRK